MNDPNEVHRRPWFLRWYGLLNLFIGLIVSLFFLLNVFVFKAFHAPSTSMSPSLEVGDYFLVDRRAYGFGIYSLPLGVGELLWTKEESRARRKPPLRGDIAVFRLPRDTSVDYVKRVIGLPGDRVQMRDGYLMLNERIVPKVPAGTASRKTYDGRVQEVPRFKETLPSGKSYFVLDARKSPLLDNTDVFRVPAGHFFVLGDNRDNSTDSRLLREVGFVPFENLIGRAGLIYWSSAPERRFTWVK